MNFEISPSQRKLCDEMRFFAESELRPGVAKRDQSGEFSRENWQRCAEQGVFGLATPKAYGGAALDMVTAVLAIEALGYGCPDNGLTLAINGQVWCVQAPLLKFGSEYQNEKYLTGMVNGSMIGCHAMTEREAGSDAFAMRTTATKTSGGYILNGTKIYVGMAPLSDIIMVFASTNPDRGRWGISVFLVDSDSEGVQLRTTSQHKMGLRTIPHGEITFHDTFVPEENLVGKPGSGASIFNASMDYERGFIFTGHVGSMARQLDESIKFAKERIQLGQPIGKLQAIANRIADMKVRLETSRMFLYRAASLIDQGKRLPLEASMAKLQIAEAFVENSLSAIRIHGGRGYMGDSEVERDLRDAVGGIIYSGTSDIQRNLIAGLLGL